jgi:hypothetical protein
MVKMNVKTRFDTKRLMRSVNRGNSKAMHQAAAYIWRVAKNSLKRGKQAPQIFKPPNWKLELGGHGPIGPESSGAHAKLTSPAMVTRSRHWAAKYSNVPPHWLAKQGIAGGGRDEHGRFLQGVGVYKPTPAGTPPKTPTRRLKKAVQFAVDRDGLSAVIGPRGDYVRNIGAVHEFGGTHYGDKYPARPFMGPALERSRPKLPRHWAGVVSQ